MIGRGNRRFAAKRAIASQFGGSYTPGTLVNQNLRAGLDRAADLRRRRSQRRSATSAHGVGRPGWFAAAWAATSILFLAGLLAIAPVSGAPLRRGLVAPAIVEGAGPGGRSSPLGDASSQEGEAAPVAPPPSAFAAGAPEPHPSAAREEVRGRLGDLPPGSGTWAVIVGVNDYPGTAHDLRSAVNDARDVDLALARLGVPDEHRLVLLDGEVTARTILGALDWLAAHTVPDAVAVFFYAGHVRKDAPGREVMVGSDGTAVSDAVLAAGLDRVPATRAWVAIAGCYGGGFDEVVRNGRILTAAAPADELAYENLDLGRSYLVEYMVRRAMIEGLAGPTVEAAFAFARAQISRDHPQRVPVQIDAVAGDLDLRPRVARPGGSAPSPAPPPPPPPPPPPSSSSGSDGGGASGSPGPASGPPPSGDPCLIGVVNCRAGWLRTG